MKDRSQIRILIVDDNKSLRKVLRSIIQYAGYGHVEEADDGCKALRILEHQSFDLIFTDWNMHFISGIELVQKIRQHPQHRHTQVVMITVNSVETDVQQALQAGANGYIIKPFVPETILQKLNQLLGESSE